MFRRKRRKPVLEPAKPYWEQASWRWSVGFIGVVVFMSCVIALTSPDDTDKAPVKKAVRVEGPLSGPIGSNGRPQHCATDDSAGSALPKAPPDDVVWHKLGVAQVPVSASAGPTRTEGKLWWCFGHTPMGAVEAAVIISSQTSGSGWREVSRQQIVPGPGRDRFEDMRSGSGNIDGQVDVSSVGVYAGFSVTSYRDSAATVKLLIQSSQSSAVQATSSMNLRWERGDWKIVPSDNGDLHTKLTQDTKASGFIMWGE